MDFLRCVVERITYQNPDNSYTVIKCKAKGYQDLVTVIANMPEVHIGSVLSIQGSCTVDAKYSGQFTAEKWEETLPATVYGIEKHLGSGLIKGISPVFAKQIVNQFGKDTLDIIESIPDRLIEVPGIGQRRVDRVKKSRNDQKAIKNIMLFLQSHDVSTAHATKILMYQIYVAYWLRFKEGKRVVVKHKDEIEVFYLPPYASKYNADKLLNSGLKRGISKHPSPR